MRTTVFQRPENDFRIRRLSTGIAVVDLYASYVEVPNADGGFDVTANVVSTNLVDCPGLEEDVVKRFSVYYNRAVAEEELFLGNQFKKAVDGVIAKLPPGKKMEIVESAAKVVRQIACGDRPMFYKQKDFIMFLKGHI